MDWLKAIEERWAKATPGPWEIGECRDGVYAGKKCLVRKDGVGEIVGVRQLGSRQDKNIEPTAEAIAQYVEFIERKQGEPEHPPVIPDEEIPF